MKNLTLWSRSGYQNNDWWFTVYKSIKNEDRPIADTARKFVVNMDHLVGMAVPQKINKEYNNICHKISSALKSFSINKIDLEEVNKMNHAKKQHFMESKFSYISRRSLISYKSKKSLSTFRIPIKKNKCVTTLIFLRRQLKCIHSSCSGKRQKATYI